ncbi:310_t:CDS:2 [Funneliformis caledonium]|uniref:310_t:CDS:1 n=1 Tax=Funneliformis caledonium TaxID=1117310 RepID=A0A9N9FKM1_9GLOM|nr:310_t:CDS:2 [Funneliformis caledonium]
MVVLKFSQELSNQIIKRFKSYSFNIPDNIDDIKNSSIHNYGYTSKASSNISKDIPNGCKKVSQPIKSQIIHIEGQDELMNSDYKSKSDYVDNDGKKTFR